jgi:DNA-binding transcriptional LysR family regulator
VVSLQNRPIDELPYIANVWQGRHIEHSFTSDFEAAVGFSKQASCVTNSIHSCLALIKAGAGIGVLPDFYLKQMEPDLVNLMPNHQLPMNTVYALNPYTHHTPPSVSLCIHSLEERLSQELFN